MLKIMKNGMHMLVKLINYMEEKYGKQVLNQNIIMKI